MPSCRSVANSGTSVADDRGDGPRPVPLLAELWYVVAADLSEPSLVNALRAVAPGTEAQSDSITVPHGAVTGANSVPLLTAVLPGSELGHNGKARPDAGQTWDWQAAETTLAQCQASVLVTELSLSGTALPEFTPQQRVTAVNSVVHVLIEHTAPAAVHWPSSQRVSDPGAFDPQALDGVLNVRLFSVGNDDGAMVMDTLGLDLFDLPDLQCHFKDFDAAEVAAMLFSTAVYVFDEGDVIDDGHTISGPRGDEHFECRHELSLLDPKRVVIDVDLGAAFAAGERD